VAAGGLFESGRYQEALQAVEEGLRKEPLSYDLKKLKRDIGDALLVAKAEHERSEERRISQYVARLIRNADLHEKEGDIGSAIRCLAEACRWRPRGEAAARLEQLRLHAEADGLASASYMLRVPVIAVASVILMLCSSFVLFFVWQATDCLDRVKRGMEDDGVVGLGRAVAACVLRWPFALLYFCWPLYMFHGGIKPKWKSLPLGWIPLMTHAGKGSRQGLTGMYRRWADATFSLASTAVCNLGGRNYFGSDESTDTWSRPRPGVFKQTARRRAVVAVGLACCLGLTALCELLFHPFETMLTLLMTG